MKILSALQIREADAYTIANEPIKSIDLMERAATACADWITEHYDKNNSFKIFCGVGNNGGDGLVIARLLHIKGYKVRAILIDEHRKLSDDCAERPCLPAPSPRACAARRRHVVFPVPRGR